MVRCTRRGLPDLLRRDVCARRGGEHVPDLWQLRPPELLPELGADVARSGMFGHGVTQPSVIRGVRVCVCVWGGAMTPLLSTRTARVVCLVATDQACECTRLGRIVLDGRLTIGWMFPMLPDGTYHWLGATQTVRCVLCRGEWNDMRRGAGPAGVLQDKGYTNMAQLQGMSSRRGVPVVSIAK
jgi:hypothetical protein